MRLLDVDYRVIKKASEIRAGLEDGSKKWVHVRTAPHSDTSVWSLLSDWLHSDEASHEDNTRKELVRIDIGVDKDMKCHLYELHRARVYNDTKPCLYIKFKCSPTFSDMQKSFHEKKVSLRLAQARLRARKAAGPSAEVLSSIMFIYNESLAC